MIFVRRLVEWGLFRVGDGVWRARQQKVYLLCHKYNIAHFDELGYKIKPGESSAYFTLRVLRGGEHGGVEVVRHGGKITPRKSVSAGTDVDGSFFVDESVSEARQEDIVAQLKMTESLFMFKRFFKYVFMCRGRKDRKGGSDDGNSEGGVDSIGSKNFFIG